jgi:heavy metal translocating P-type ATPase
VATEAVLKLARPFLVAIPATGLAVGSALYFAGYAEWSSPVWAAATLPVLVALLAEIVTSLRRGDVGLDIVAALSMSAALVFGEHLAAAVVALMYAGGQYLESFAARRARREMTALLARAPRSALRYLDSGLEEIELGAIAPGNRLLVRQGDVVPVDGVVAKGSAVLDQSTLTGESLPVRHNTDAPVMSGAVNVGEAFDLVASHRAAESTFAGIVRLIEAAQKSKAPMSRLADRFALVFLAVTVFIAFAAWLWSGDPIRAVAVLVVATPCPLILAVPVAIVSGLSRAAKHGILVKGGKALETLARVRALVIDKTGTLTEGRAQIVSTDIASTMPAREILQLGASLEQASRHVIAQAIVAEAQARGIQLSLPSATVETPGEGVEGEVEGKRVIVGGVKFVAAKIGVPAASLRKELLAPGSIAVAVAVDGKAVGVLILSDKLREGTEQLLREIKGLGVERITLATGDRREVALDIAAGLSLDEVRWEQTPDQKVLLVVAERKHGPVMMIGDGINDAPALAAADLGVAMGSKGAAASAEAADVVLLIDRLDRILPAMKIARRSRRIALESVYVGLGLSLGGMIAAAFGYLTPVQGALFQELIDVAVILNALRALRDPREPERAGRRSG